jgi:hypothetical protein
MIRKNDHAAATAKPRGRSREQGIKAMDLVVDRDTQRLESARCRIDAAMTTDADRTFDYSAQFAGGFEWTTAARLDDRACYPPRGALLTVGLNDVREAFLALFIDDIVGTECLALVHSHIERTVSPETESTRPIVKGKAAHAEVGENRANAGNAALIKDGFKVAEIGLTQGKARCETLEPQRRGAQSACVAINSQQMSIGLFENPLGMAARADRRVNHCERLGSADEPHHLIHHHRHMLAARRAQASFLTQAHEI